MNSSLPLQRHTYHHFQSNGYYNYSTTQYSPLGTKQTHTNKHRQINLGIILLNSQGIAQDNTTHIHIYTTHTISTSNALHDGSAILVKSNMKHKIIDNFDTDILHRHH